MVTSDVKSTGVTYGTIVSDKSELMRHVFDITIVKGIGLKLKF